jgi:TIR domain/RDD family
MVRHIFISYVSEDKSVADTICAQLEGKDLQCWIAPRNIAPGEKYAPAIIHAIDTAKIVVVVFSHHAEESANVRTEIERAFNQGKTIIPFRIENVEPSDEIQYFIGGLQWLDAFSGSLDEHISQLAETIMKNHDLLSELQGSPESTPSSEIRQYDVISVEEVLEEKENEKLKLKGSRILSSGIDFCLGFTFGFLLFFLFGFLIDALIPHATLLLSTAENPTMLHRFYIISQRFLIILGIIYWYAVFDLSNMRSIGRILLGLRIQSNSDDIFTIKRKLFRLLIKIFPFFFIISGSFLPDTYILESIGWVLLVVWGIPVFLTSRSQYIPDLGAGTVVCFDNKSKG